MNPLDPLKPATETSWTEWEMELPDNSWLLWVLRQVYYVVKEKALSVLAKDPKKDIIGAEPFLVSQKKNQVDRLHQRLNKKNFWILHLDWRQAYINVWLFDRSLSIDNILDDRDSDPYHIASIKELVELVENQRQYLIKRKMLFRNDAEKSQIMSTLIRSILTKLLTIIEDPQLVEYGRSEIGRIAQALLITYKGTFKL